ncbi:MAG: VOC family protein [Alphaproteobacteria bacterium]|nr:VOC family protein [Alphaproteobacteria bacterium]
MSIAKVAILVRDYDEAIAWYRRCFGFRLIEDRPAGRDKRWVVMRPPGSAGCELLLSRAATPEQSNRIGDQTGGRVFLFLETDDFARDHARMLGEGVEFTRAPRREAYGVVAVCLDLYGNRWDLIHPTGEQDWA